MNRLQVYFPPPKVHRCRCGRALIQLGWTWVCPVRSWWNLFWHRKTTSQALEMEATKN